MFNSINLNDIAKRNPKGSFLRRQDSLRGKAQAILKGLWGVKIRNHQLRSRFLSQAGTSILDQDIKTQGNP